MLDINDIYLKQYNYSIKCSNPLIIVIEDFLSSDEISSLLKTAEERYVRSFVVGDDDATSVHHQRTSSSCMFSQSESQVLSYIEDRVATIIGLDKIYQEPFQLVKYEKDQQYASHFDFFDDVGTSSSYAKNEVLNRGQRCLTILAYLEQPETGGETFFPRLNLHVPPKKGSAVLWFNTDKEGKVDPRTEHGGMPVSSGTKVAMNIWIRTKPYV